MLKCREPFRQLRLTVVLRRKTVRRRCAQNLQNRRRHRRVVYPRRRGAALFVEPADVRPHRSLHGQDRRARDDLLERVPELRTTNLSLTLLKLISDEEARLSAILPKLPAAKEKRVVQALPAAALGERWSVRALQLIQVAQASQRSA